MEKHPWLDYKNWAVVGASTKPERYGYKIVNELAKAKYNVLPITPRYTHIEGIIAYSSLLDIEGEIDVVNFVVNPRIGIKVLADCISKGVKRIWLQPGTSSEEIVSTAKANNIEVIEACVLVALSR